MSYFSSFFRRLSRATTTIIPNVIKPPTIAPTELASLGNSFREQRSSTSKLIFLMGGPGSGKGTLGAQLSLQHSDTRHVSVGKLLRNASKHDPNIASVVNNGGIVSSSVSIGILLRHLCEHPSTECWIVDGFPRTLSNAQEWASVAPQPSAFVALNVGEEVMKGRLRKRERADDTPQIIESRMNKFWKEWTPLKMYYHDLGLVVNVDGHGPPEDVLQRYMKFMNR